LSTRAVDDTSCFVILLRRLLRWATFETLKLCFSQHSHKKTDPPPPPPKSHQIVLNHISRQYLISSTIRACTHEDQHIPAISSYFLYLQESIAGVSDELLSLHRQPLKSVTRSTDLN
ncbi:hypothetical protein ALC53_04553, partial [Atta colombica]